MSLRGHTEREHKLWARSHELQMALATLVRQCRPANWYEIDQEAKQQSREARNAWARATKLLSDIKLGRV